MTLAHVVKFETPKGVSLNGLIFGTPKAKRIIVFLHGMTGNVFSMHTTITALVNRDTSVLIFNSRGHDIISTTKRTVGKTTRYGTAGTAQEVFTDCVDDIDGAIRAARAHGARDIYLAGHSTGAQKIVYWHSKTKDKKGVRGIMLFGPLSDYAEGMAINPNRIERGVKAARALIAKNKPHALMPDAFTPEFPLDAQRYLSLNTPDSPEELFTYGQERVVPKKLRAVEIPMLVFLAEEDEYGSRPATDLAAWFTEHIYTGEAVVVPGVNHGFKGGEKLIAKSVDSFMKEGYN